MIWHLKKISYAIFILDANFNHNFFSIIEAIKHEILLFNKNITQQKKKILKQRYLK